MRYPSLAVSAVLCAHLAVPSSLGHTSTSGGAPAAKIGVVVEAFVVPATRAHRNSLPNSFGVGDISSTHSPFEQKYVSPIFSPSLTQLKSSIIDAPQTLSTSHDDDENDKDEDGKDDAKLEADAEAFFEQMMARRSSIMQGTDEPSVVEEEDEKPEEAIISEIAASAGSSDEEIAAEWHNDQMANALASVQSTNGRAALERIDQEESRVRAQELEAEKPAVFEVETAHAGTEDGQDEFAFQRSRLEQQLRQSKVIEAVNHEPVTLPIETVGELVDLIVRGADSASTSYAFQQARLERQLAQPRQEVQPDSLAVMRIPGLHAAASVKDTGSKSNEDVFNAFQRNRLARQLAQPRSYSIVPAGPSPILESPSIEGDDETPVSSSPAKAMTEEEIAARRAYFRHIEELSAEVVRKASEAVDRVLEEQRLTEAKITTSVVTTPPSNDSQIAQQNKVTLAEISSSLLANISPEQILATVSPERNLFEYADDSETEIARYAALHLARAAFDTTRAAAFTLGALFESFSDPQLRISNKKSATTTTGDAALAFFNALGKSKSSHLAVEAAGAAAHQYSSFLAACGAMGLRAGVKAKVYTKDYIHQQVESQTRLDEAKAEEKLKMLAKVAKLAEEKSLQEERIAAERKKMEKIRRKEEERIAAEKKALVQLKVRIENEKKRVEEERIAAELKAIEDIRRRAVEKQRSLDMELETNGLANKKVNGLANKKVVEIRGASQNGKISSSSSASRPNPSPLFFVETEKAATPFFFVDA